MLSPPTDPRTLEEPLNPFETQGAFHAYRDGINRARVKACAAANVALALAALLFLSLPGAPDGEWFLVSGSAICIAAGLTEIWLIRKARASRNAIGALGLVMTAGVVLLEIYFGAGSAISAAFAIGIFAEALNGGRRWPLAMTCLASGAHLSEVFLRQWGMIPSRGLQWNGSSPELYPLIAAHAAVICIYLTAYAAGRNVRQANEDLTEALATEAREAAVRGALLDEARRDLAQARAGNPGRFSGATLGDFELGPLLGRGGMGEVYEGHRSTDGRVAAVKVLRFDNGSVDADALAFFEAECASLARIRSPHVVELYDFGDADVPYLAMEKLSGESLRACLKRVVALTDEETLTLVEQVAEGLEAAHGVGVVHRDLKPENIFRRSSTGAPWWKIVDFGIASIRSSSGTPGKAVAVGTLPYMAPEALRPDGTVDARQDVFALARIALECLTGRRPPPSAGAFDRYALRLAEAERESLAALRPEVAWVLERGLAAYPEERWPSASTMVAALREAINQEEASLRAPARTAHESIHLAETRRLT